MKKRINWLVAILSILFVQTIYAEEPSIFEAGMKITLAMHKAEIMDTFKDKYKVTECPDDPRWREDCWMVHKLDTNEIIVSVKFENEKLVWASHTWKHHDGQSTAYSLGNSIFSLLSNITNDKETNATIRTKTSRGADVTIEEVQIDFSHRDVTIHIIHQRDLGRNSIQISESIFQ